MLKKLLLAIRENMNILQIYDRIETNFFTLPDPVIPFMLQDNFHCSTEVTSKPLKEKNQIGKIKNALNR